MLHAVQQVPRTSFTATNGLNTEEFVNYPTIIETACGRYGDMVADGWDILTGVNLIADKPLPDGSDSHPLRLVKTVESHRLANGNTEIVERLGHTIGGMIVPIRVKYISASIVPNGNIRRTSRSYVYHGNLQTLFTDLIPPTCTAQDFQDISIADPKMIFTESVGHYSHRAELPELAEEVADAVQKFHQQNPLMCHVSPNIYCTSALAMTMAPYLNAMMSQAHVRMDRAAQKGQIWSPDYIGRWASKVFVHDIRVYDPLTGKAISGGYHPRYLLGHLHTGTTVFDTTMPPAIQFDLDVVDTAPPELRDLAYAIDMFPVTDYIAELDVRSPSDTPVTWIGYGDRYLGVWALTKNDIHYEGVMLARLIRRAVTPPVSAVRIRLTKTFADEALLEFFGDDRTLLWGAYFDFARLSLGSVGVATDSQW